MRQRVAFFCVGLCAALSGCGGTSHSSSSHTTSTSTTTPVASTAATGTTAAAGITGRILTDNELKGFSGSPGPVYTSVRNWLNSEEDNTLSADEARLTPGAHGFSYLAGGQGGINVAFVKGPYYYVVGQEVGPGPSSVPSDLGNLIAAAQHLYHRVSA
ncbi:MAG TPA: hypothetical protein VMF57_22880 [Solirubrobacteraceae bacterium]|nr:hypothetical protein [Solirubrobacteraceae bacterium]